MDDTATTPSRLDLREADDAPVPMSSITSDEVTSPQEEAVERCSTDAGDAPRSERVHGREGAADAVLGAEGMDLPPSRLPAGDLMSLVTGSEALAPGTPLVHFAHGVGRNGGLQRLEIDGREHELLAIDYADEERVYVPLDALHLVSRHGLEGEEAPLHAVGDPGWLERRREAAEQARDVAGAAIERYARRRGGGVDAGAETRGAEGGETDENRCGRSDSATSCRPIVADPERLERFASSFAHEPTPDQRAAIDAVLADMAKSRPMDRVVCGDVGFGKTEVAMRAAFAAVDAGKQVALFAPTTVLARQHRARFAARFADLPTRIGSLTRLDTAEEAEATLAAMRAGDVDIVVGTHALLCDEASFADLALVVVDEEQRFGVEQKRCIEALGEGTHLLTLSATPIPRTLGACLAGLREFSLVATPPSGRQAVETLVGALDERRVVEALEHELARGGQVFAVHNAVRSIESFAARLRRLAPEADVRVAHAQMPEEALAALMDDFAAHRFDVLVSTTIVENGVDIPNANTLLVDRADELGLAQLHQLRGRVGRSDRSAHALFLTPPVDSLGARARGRLAAVEAAGELGAGPELAIRDLCLRGGGDLLGEAQSGAFADVGFALYTTLLGQAMRDGVNGREFDPAQPFGHHVEIDLAVPPMLSATHVPDADERLRHALRIAHAGSGASLEAIVNELRERHGPLPAESERFVNVVRLRRRAERLGVERISIDASCVRVTFDPAAMTDEREDGPEDGRGSVGGSVGESGGVSLATLLAEESGTCRLVGNEIRSRRPPPDEAAGPLLVHEILAALG